MGLGWGGEGGSLWRKHCEHVMGLLLSPGDWELGVGE